MIRDVFRNAPRAVLPGTPPAEASAELARSRARRKRIGWAITGGLVALLLALCATSLMVGNTFYSASEVLHALAGHTVPGASYTVVELRFPRLVLGLAVGAACGLSGSIFQTLLGNQLASPDIVGVSAGAAATGVVAIVVFRLPQSLVSVCALVGALAVAGAIYLLAFRRGRFSGTRLILVGIGLAAIVQSIITYVLSRAAAWDIGTATRWLNGSLNGATWERITPVLVTCVVVIPVVIGQLHNLSMVRLGDDTARAVGVNVARTRMILMIGAVTLVAVATAAAGPIAFVAFMSGPIAARLVRGRISTPLPAAMVGAVLTVGADCVASSLLGTRYPVGVVTGVLGAPFLIYLLIRSHRKGMS